MADDHEKMLQDRYILDFERSKQVLARRNALLANWLASHMRRNDTAAVTAEVLRLARSASSDDVLCDDLLAGFRERGNDFDRVELRGKMQSLIMDAAEQLAEEDGLATLH